MEINRGCALFLKGGKAAQCDVQIPACLHSHLAVRRSGSTPHLRYSAFPPIIWPRSLEIKNPGMEKKQFVELWSVKESIRYSLCWGHRASGHFERCFYVLLISNIVFHRNMKSCLLIQSLFGHSLLNKSYHYQQIIWWLLEWMDEWHMP